MVIDYFIKWVNASSYAHVTQNMVKRFVENELIYQHDSPKTIVIDNT
jgi:hypothetical protein